MKYVSKPTECEAMEWVAWQHVSYLDGEAKKIVEWVNANGGEARYEPSYDPGPPGASFTSARNPAHGPCIAVRTKDGWKHASPGWYVVMGTATFEVWEKNRSPENSWIRDFYPCDPETFERRWQAVQR